MSRCSDAAPSRSNQPVSDNVVLLGSHRSNPWAELYDSSLNFQFDYDEAARKAIVRNRNPRAGESATYLISGEGAGIREGYATLTFLPNQGHTAHVLIVAGTDMEATEAVGQLATTEAEFQPVAGKLAPDGRLPYFEALFKTRRFGGAPDAVGGIVGIGANLHFEPLGDARDLAQRSVQRGI